MVNPDNEIFSSGHYVRLGKEFRRKGEDGVLMESPRLVAAIVPVRFMQGRFLALLTMATSYLRAQKE